MSIDFASSLLCAVFLLAVLGTWLVRFYALRQGVVDIPNARSSHQLPTPRGGGLGLVAAFVAGISVCLWVAQEPGSYHVFLISMLISTLAVATVGFLDDHGGIPVAYRLPVHFASAILLVWAKGDPLILDLGFATISLGFAGDVLSVLGIVWLLNLTNFMDGIDGIAGIQTVAACAVASALVLFTAGSVGLALPSAVLGAAALGFLVFNFPPAKIFMGDIGSGAIGLLFGGFTVWHATTIGPQWLYVWLVLLGVFVVDASYTLVRRALRKQKLSQAHRSHAFQRASRRCGAHKPVTLAVLLIILFWLAPWATAVAFDKISGIVALVISYLPLVALAWYFKAGAIDD